MFRAQGKDSGKRAPAGTGVAFQEMAGSKFVRSGSGWKGETRSTDQLAQLG
jgi:hypothetical protein